MSSPTESVVRGPHLKLALWLGVAAALATPALFPYLIAMTPAPLRIPLWKAIAIGAAQTGVLTWLFAWLGLYLGGGHGLDAPWLRAWIYRQPMPARRTHWMLAALLGVLAGIAVAGIEQIQPPPTPRVLDTIGQTWRGALASLYGGTAEEILCRLGSVSLLVWLLAWPRRQQARSWMFIVAIVLAALLFGAGHLPFAFSTGIAHTPFAIGQIIFLNSLVGLVCGGLFWKFGLEHAMLAHFCADLILHVASPLVLGTA
ncbi:CAAX protease self-immunity [Dyella sp. OK004]|uniref:CPBP family glutamic-type intramembrane protease n=1 Tax=Dyella sp. OK004 TaxID=1855292 RepID=UPI0008E17A66|nr:CPBP family glutamic-type intramembrane protease [Dyella sp. OK004]SFS19787.1 CAAX protease self-immunity [Dyella sp. OK004]